MAATGCVGKWGGEEEVECEVDAKEKDNGGGRGIEAALPLKPIPDMTTDTLVTMRQARAVLEQSMMVEVAPAPCSVTVADKNASDVMLDEQLAAPENVVSGGSVMTPPPGAASSMNC